jgi:hypothetical protein
MMHAPAKNPTTNLVVRGSLHWQEKRLDYVLKKFSNHDRGDEL